MPKALSDEELRKIDAYWRAANYLSVGQIYLKDNPLLERPLTIQDIKPRLLGHFGTTPGLNFIYVHLNRLIRMHKANMMYVVGPGHGAPGIIANTYLEGSYTELYPNIERDRHGLKSLFRQFSWPYGIPSHDAANVPGSINEGGELGYSIVHAFGAAFDNPDLIVTCIVGDGEAETATLAASWHSNKFLNPITDGAVLPILHLNGFKIANPTILARIANDELESLFRGYGYKANFLEGDDPDSMHQAMASILDDIYKEIRSIQQKARDGNDPTRPMWPMLILRTPKGWTGPKVVDGKQIEGTWRAHQVPLEEVRTNPEHLKILEGWLRSYRPEELFDELGALRSELADIAPKGLRRMGMNRHANGGQLLEPLVMPDFRKYAVACPNDKEISATTILGSLLRDVMENNLASRNFRVFGPDETASNRLQAIYQASGKRWNAEYAPVDEDLSVDGRVMEVLSENLCQGWLEGYLLTGRHGFFSCYEAFIHIVDSMFNQHAKWLQESHYTPWRQPIASLNYLLSSHVWRQDHNGFSHQDPGFIDHVANKNSETVRIYLPPDANTLLSVVDHCLRSRNYINLIIAGKQPAPVYLEIEAAVRHTIAGLGIWDWAGNEDRTAGADPDVVFACAGDVPTMEALAAVTVLRDWAPNMKMRFVNIVDLFTLESQRDHPHGINDEEFDRIFTKSQPVIFAFHGYPTIVHKLTYKRTNHDNFHVHGFRERGTTTTPFDMTVRNRIDRYTLALDAIRSTPRLAARVAESEQKHSELMQRHRLYVSEYGEDMPEIRDWKWTVAQ